MMHNLIPCQISKAHFELLLSLTSIHSEKLKKALEAYFVDGRNKKEICEKFGVNSSYFSLKVNVIKDVSRTVILLYPFYSELYATKNLTIL